MMMRSYKVFGKTATGEPVEIEIKAKTAAHAVEAAAALRDGNTYEAARKQGCNCGSR